MKITQQLEQEIRNYIDSEQQRETEELVPVSFTFHRSTLRMLNVIARLRGISRSELLRELAESHIREQTVAQ